MNTAHLGRCRPAAQGADASAPGIHRRGCRHSVHVYK